MENKFLWLCAFIDVLETLYVGIYKIGSFPSTIFAFIFLGPRFFSLWRIFFIESEPFVKKKPVTPKQSVCHEVTRTFLKCTDAPRPKGSTAEAAAAHPALGPGAPASPAAPPPSTPLRVQTRSTPKLVLDVKSGLNKITFVSPF